MKTYILILLVLSCSSSILHNRYIEKEYYDNGKLKYEIQKFNNKIDGYTKYWNEDGYILNEVNYSNGLLHGEWKEYHLSGNLKYSITYQYGLKDGYELWYYDNGIKQSEVLYKQDIIIADIIRWDENGNLIYK